MEPERLEQVLAYAERFPGEIDALIVDNERLEALLQKQDAR